jgi:hypothetical protein
MKKQQQKDQNLESYFANLLAIAATAQYQPSFGAFLYYLDEKKKK